MSETYWCEYAWLPEGPQPSVAISVENGRISSVTRNTARTGTVMAGMVMPGFANVHSHAFHRALRGRTHAVSGTFWTWRQHMYRIAQRLDPDSYYRLARGVFTEMLLAGYTSVGEFHYVHHGQGGVPYADPHAMAHALVAAAQETGIRLTVLDSCYLSGGVNGAHLDAMQQRFTDGDADRWAARVSAFDPGAARVRRGAAVHSVRAVPVDQIPVVVDFAHAHSAPLHAHVSEQQSENQACLAVHGRSPIEVFAEAGALDERFVGIHATHPAPLDVTWMGSSGASVCLCPTTEQDLGDGVGPARELAEAGARLSIGSDSHAVVDPFAELRGLEMGERLVRESRGHFDPIELMRIGTAHAAIGWPEVAGIVTDSPADLVRITRNSMRTAGSALAGIPLCATAGDVRDVMVDGDWVVRQGAHVRIDEPATGLAAAIEELNS